MQKNSGMTGMTIMELMIAIAIIGILAGVSAIMVLSRLPEYKLSSAVSELEGNLQWARLRAIKANSEYRVVFDENNETYQIFSDDGGDGWGGGNDTVARTIDLEKYHAGVNFPLAGGPITFTKRGTATSGTILITNKNNTPTFQIRTTVAGGMTTTRLLND